MDSELQELRVGGRPAMVGGRSGGMGMCSFIQHLLSISPVAKHGQSSGDIEVKHSTTREHSFCSALIDLLVWRAGGGEI